MSAVSTKASSRVLRPMDRILEVGFGLIMVLTVTCSLSVTESGHGEVRTMLAAALGCNLAWGIIDGFMYLVASFSERGAAIRTLRALRETEEPARAHALLAEAMPDALASLLSVQEFESLRHRLIQLPEPPPRPSLTKGDWLGAVAVFLLVFLSTFPVVVPFLFLRDLRLALRISNAVAIVLLFATGHQMGRYAGHRPWTMGAGTVVLGGALVGIAIALGG